MLLPANPFVVTGDIPDAYFCDRTAETARIIKSIANGNNLVLISPRRMGKIGLITHCYRRPAIADSYHTFFVDILHTNDLAEFTFFLGKAIYNRLQPRGEKFIKAFLSALSSLTGKFGFDIATGFPAFSLELGDIDRPEYTLQEIFSYLANADRPCIVTIDEFQQIARYPEKDVEALLRTHIQKMRNCHFIFAGSKRHLMQEMFLSASKPFYQSADILELRTIPREAYIPFIIDRFTDAGRAIDPTAAAHAYDLFNGHTYYVQRTLNEAFSNTRPGDTCTQETVDEALADILALNRKAYAQILSDLSESQKPVLVAIAKAGQAESITSASFIRRYRLKSASSVQSALKKLLDLELITRNGQAYSISDLFLARWIREMYS